MARVTTKTGVANLTATLLKIDPVSNIDPPQSGSKFARQANLWYDDTRREVLSESDWDCAKKRQQMAAESTGPAFGWTYRYLLPADYLRVSTINDEKVPETEYEIEDGYLLCDIKGPLNFRYIYDQEDIAKWSPKLLQSIARKLAANTAYFMTGNRTFQQEKEDEYRLYLSESMTIDAQANPPKKVQKSKWKTVKEAGAVGANLQGRVVT